MIVVPTRNCFRLALLLAMVGGLMAWPQPAKANPRNGIACTGGTSSGSFPGLDDSQACVDGLVAESCSGNAASGGCDPAGTFAGSDVSLECIAGGGTSAGTFPGLGNSQTCTSLLAAECCTGKAVAGGCSCDQAGDCTGSIVCKECIAGGEMSAGTFPGLGNSQTCTALLAAQCCSGQAVSGGCSCDLANDCTGAIVCAPEPASGGLGAAALCAIAIVARLGRRASPSRRGSCDA